MYSLNFDLRTQGLSDLDKIARIVAEIGKEGKLTSAELIVFDAGLRKSVESGKSLEQALKAVATGTVFAKDNVRQMAKDVLASADAAKQAADAHVKLANQIAEGDARAAAIAKQAANERIKLANQVADAEVRAAATVKQSGLASIFGSGDQSAGFLKGGVLGTLGLGAIGGAGLQVGMAAIQAIKSGIESVTKGFSDASHETVLFADRLGITVTQARELQNVGALTGVRIESLASSSRVLAIALEDSTGSGKKAATALHELGVSAFNADGSIREEGQVLEEFINKLSGVADPTKRTELGFLALGKSFKEIKPAIDELPELTKRMHDLGIEIDASGIKKGNDLDRTFRELGLTFDALRNKIGAGIAVPLTVVLQAIMGTVNEKGAGGLLPPVLLTSLGLKLAGSAAQGVANNLPNLGPFAGLANAGSGAPDFIASIADPANAARLRSAYDNSEEGIRERIKTLSGTIASDRQREFDPTLPASTQNEYKSKVDANTAELAKLNARLDAIHDAPGIASQYKSDLAGFLGDTNVSANPESDRIRATAKDLLSRTTNPRDRFNIGLSSFIQAQRTYGDAPNVGGYEGNPLSGIQGYIDDSLSGQVDPRISQRNQDAAAISGVRTGADQQARLLGLTGDKGNELNTLLQEKAIRQDAISQELQILQAHQEIHDMDAERFRLQKEANDADFKYQESVLRLRDQQEKKLTGDLTGIVEGLLHGQGAKAFSGFLNGIESTIISNALRPVAESILKNPSLHVQDGKSPLGKLLAGTPFGPNAESVPLKIDQSNALLAQIVANTALARSGGGGSFGGRSLWGDIGIPGLNSDGGGFETGSYGEPIIGPGNVGGAVNIPGVTGASIDGVAPAVSATNSGGGFSAGQGVADAGAAVAGGFGVARGIKQGGGKGTLGAISSATGAAAVIDPEPISKTILAAIAITTGLIGDLLGDPKQIRQKAIDSELNNNRYFAPTALNVSRDVSGNYVDFGQDGQLRTSPFAARPQVTQPYQIYRGNGDWQQLPGREISPFSTQGAAPQVVINVQTPHAKSFIDYSTEIVAAVAHGINSGNGRQLTQTLARVGGSR